MKITKFLNRNPTKKGKLSFEDEFFASFQSNEIDFNSDVFVEAFASTEQLVDTFPLATLSDLKELTESLKQLTIQAHSKPISLGDIGFMQRNADTGKIVETGIIWYDASVGMDFTNFVITTLESIYNNSDIRFDDDIEFVDIQQSAQQLIAAAETFAQFSGGEMPELPPESAYDAALKGNRKIVLRESKIVEAPVNVTVGLPDEASETTTKAPGPVNGSEAFPVANSAASFPAQQRSSGEESSKKAESNSDTNKVPKKDKPVNKRTKTDAPHGSRLDVILGQLSDLHIKTPKFKTKQIEAKSVDPASSEYIDSMLNVELLEANEFLEASANAYKTTIGQSIAGQIKNIQVKQSEKIAKLRSIDTTKEISTSVKNALDKKFQHILSESLENAHSEHDRLIEEEEIRHKQRLQEIEANLIMNTDSIRKSNALDKNREMTIEIDKRISEAKKAQDEEIKNLNKEFDNKAHLAVESQLRKLVNEAASQLAQNFAKLEKQLTDKRKQLVEEHTAALKEVTEAKKVELQQKDVEKLEGDVTTLTQTVQRGIANHTEEKTKMTEQLQQTKAELEAAQAQVKTSNATTESLQSVNETMTNAVKALSHNEGTNQQFNLNDMLDTFTKFQALTQTAQTPIQGGTGHKSNNPWKAVSIGLMSAVLIGGAAFGVINQQQTNEEAHAREIKKLTEESASKISSMQAREVKLEKAASEASTNKAQEEAANSSNVSQTQNQANSTNQVASTVPTSGVTTGVSTAPSQTTTGTQYVSNSGATTVQNR